jgi:hypothetical protein
MPANWAELPSVLVTEISGFLPALFLFRSFRLVHRTFAGCQLKITELACNQPEFVRPEYIRELLRAQSLERVVDAIQGGDCYVLDVVLREVLLKHAGTLRALTFQTGESEQWQRWWLEHCEKFVALRELQGDLTAFPVLACLPALRSFSAWGRLPSLKLPSPSGPWSCDSLEHLHLTLTDLLIQVDFFDFFVSLALFPRLKSLSLEVKSGSASPCPFTRENLSKFKRLEAFRLKIPIFTEDADVFMGNKLLRSLHLDLKQERRWLWTVPVPLTVEELSASASITQPFLAFLLTLRELRCLKLGSSVSYNLLLHIANECKTLKSLTMTMLVAHYSGPFWDLSIFTNVIFLDLSIEHLYPGQMEITSLPPKLEHLVLRGVSLSKDRALLECIETSSCLQKFERINSGSSDYRTHVQEDMASLHPGYWDISSKSQGKLDWTAIKKKTIQ